MKLAVLTLTFFLSCHFVFAQSDTGTKVYGKPYNVPGVKVYLTDEETGEPFADRKVVAKYYWQWDVIKSTPETQNMSNIRYLEIEVGTDSNGVVTFPAKTIIPWRPVIKGAELSEPYFTYGGISVRDEKHQAYLSVFDAKRELRDARGEVHRVVPLLIRPSK